MSYKERTELQCLLDLVHDIFVATPFVIKEYLSGDSKNNYFAEELKDEKERKREKEVKKALKKQNHPMFEYNLKQYIKSLDKEVKELSYSKVDYKVKELKVYKEMPLEYKLTKEISILKIKHWNSEYIYLDSFLQNNIEVAKYALKDNPFLVSFADSSVYKNKEIMKFLLSNYSFTYKYLHYELKTDKQYLLSIVKKNPFVYCCLDDRFKKDIDFLSLIYDKHRLIYFTIPKTVREKYGTNREEFVKNFSKKHIIFSY